MKDSNIQNLSNEIPGSVKLPGTNWLSARWLTAIIAGTAAAGLKTGTTNVAPPAQVSITDFVPAL